MAIPDRKSPADSGTEDQDERHASSPVAPIPTAPDPKERGYWRMVRRLFWKRRLNRIATYVILLIMGIAVFADFLASDKPILLSLDGEVYVFPNVFNPPELRIYDNLRLLDEMGEDDWAVFPPILYGYNTHDLSAVLVPPGGDHLLGTDPVGRDVLSRMIHGSRVSLAVGFLAVAIMVIVGVLLGALAGYYGGWVDGIIMRIVEIFLSLPTFLVLVTMLAVIAPEGWGAVVAMMVVIGLTRWTGVARLIRGEILKVKTQEYVEASRALGGSDLRIIFRHIIPNSISPVLVSATFGVASAILIESALSFLGFGIPADMASWGGVLTEARRHVDAWWLAVFPGFAIFITVTAYNLMGEGLRDAIDPKLKT